MDTEVMKNMVVLKNLPSNMIEQAFIILRPNLKAKELNTMEIKQSDGYNNLNNKFDNYIVEEAELLLSEYISKIEKKNAIRKNNDIERKYKKLKKRAIISCIFAIICLIINIVF